MFLSDSIPSWVGPAGYCLLAAVGVGCIPLVYPPGELLVLFVLGAGDCRGEGPAAPRPGGILRVTDAA